MVIPQKKETELYDLVIPLLDIYQKKQKQVGTWTYTYIPTFKAALFTIAKSRSKPSPLTDG